MVYDAGALLKRIICNKQNIKLTIYTHCGVFGTFLYHHIRNMYTIVSLTPSETISIQLKCADRH